MSSKTGSRWPRRTDPFERWRRLMDDSGQRDPRTGGRADLLIVDPSLDTEVTRPCHCQVCSSVNRTRLRDEAY